MKWIVLVLSLLSPTVQAQYSEQVLSLGLDSISTKLGFIETEIAQLALQNHLQMSCASAIVDSKPYIICTVLNTATGNVQNHFVFLAKAIINEDAAMNASLAKALQAVAKHAKQTKTLSRDEYIKLYKQTYGGKEPDPATVPDK